MKFVIEAVHTWLAISSVINKSVTRTRTSNNWSPNRGIGNRTFLASLTRISNNTGILASLLNAGHLGQAITVEPAVWLMGNNC